MADDDQPFYTVCACCGARLTVREWPPIIVEETDEDGNTSLYSFCDEKCKRNWADNA